MTPGTPMKGHASHSYSTVLKKKLILDTLSSHFDNLTLE